MNENEKWFKALFNVYFYVIKIIINSVSFYSLVYTFFWILENYFIIIFYIIINKNWD